MGHHCEGGRRHLTLQNTCTNLRDQLATAPVCSLSQFILASSKFAKVKRRRRGSNEIVVQQMPSVPGAVFERALPRATISRNKHRGSRIQGRFLHLFLRSSSLRRCSSQVLPGSAKICVYMSRNNGSQSAGVCLSSPFTRIACLPVCFALSVLGIDRAFLLKRSQARFRSHAFFL
jgi:hypothetical protein